VSIFLALLHHPVLNRHGDVSTTAVTNVDVHDLARASRTYNVKRFFVVTPIDLQRLLVGRIVRHWREGPGGKRLPTRAQAFEVVEVVESLQNVTDWITDHTGHVPLVAVTGASLREDATSFSEVRTRIESGDRPVLVVLGTGHGLTPEVVESADLRIMAIENPTPGGYNHLSVRSAALVILDRLLGKRE
jgi:hypothetical protein